MTKDVDEMIDCLEAWVFQLEKAKADDGKITVSEIGAAGLATMPQNVSAVMGSWNIPDQIRNAPEAEKERLLGRFASVSMRLVAVFWPK
jgi:hypothetical protein